MLTTNVYMHRLRNRPVLDECIAQGVMYGEFGHATGHSDDDTYSDLRFREPITQNVFGLSDTRRGLLVSPEMAELVKAEQQREPEPPDPPVHDPREEDTDTPISPPTRETPQADRREQDCPGRYRPERHQPAPRRDNPQPGRRRRRDNRQHHHLRAKAGRVFGEHHALDTREQRTARPSVRGIGWAAVTPAQKHLLSGIFVDTPTPLSQTGTRGSWSIETLNSQRPENPSGA